MKLLTLMTSLYLGQVASFITKTRDMDSQETEEDGGGAGAKL